MGDEHDEWVKKIGVNVAPMPVAPSSAGAAGPPSLPTSLGMRKPTAFNAATAISPDSPLAQGKPPAKDDDKKPAKPKADEEMTGLVDWSRDGADVVGTITLHSKRAGNLGETQFAGHIGPDGKFKQLELDITAIKKKFEGVGNVMDLEATISLNGTADLDHKMNRLILGNAQVQAKAEIEAHFKSSRIPGFEKLTFKLTGTSGTGGSSIAGVVEIPIPGS